MAELFDDLNPAPRLLMGPGPVNADPRVLQAMSMPLLGQFDPQFTSYMNEVMSLVRQVFQSRNHWSFLIDGTARAAIESVLVSVVAPGDRVLVPVSGRFGQLLAEIAERCRADVRIVEAEWGTVFSPDQIEDAIKQHDPKLVAAVHGDTSTTMAQPLKEIGEICRARDILLYADATATVGGPEVPADDWNVDAVTAGLQKCLSGPPGIAPICFNERVEEIVLKRKHIERGIRPDGFNAAEGDVIQSNYFDLPMLMDYWSDKRLNHHTEATSMLYAARESIRIALAEGLANRAARHALTSRALTSGLTAMGLGLFGDQDHKMSNVTGVYIPESVTEGEVVRGCMLNDFGIEIGTSFGPLHGKIWRIGTMGFMCTKQNTLTCLAALDIALRQNGYAAPTGAGVDAALKVYREAE